MSPRDWYSHGLGRRLQTVWFPAIADERYVSDRAWERAVLDECPFHPGGACGLLRHGSYPRVHPAGARVARFLCPSRGETISLMPAFLSARLPATLDEVEAVVDAVEASPSIARAVEATRPADDEQAVTSISAARWVRRRLRPILAALVALVTLVPELWGCSPTLCAIRAQLGRERVLVALRELGRAHLGALCPPLGLHARAGR
jgi:hypothetical protein